jgi:hypothetical protein
LNIYNFSKTKIMGTFLNKIFESQVHQRHCGCRKCSRNNQSKSLLDEIFEENLDQELSTAEIDSAVQYNRKSAEDLGWEQYRQQIVEKIFGLLYQLDEYDFAERVADWQAKNGFYGKDVDGKIGKGTWGKMKAMLGISSPVSAGALALVNTVMPSGSRHTVAAPSKNYGVPETITALQWLVQKWDILYPDIEIRIGDISKKGGGEISPHDSHRIGLDADIGLVVRSTKERIGNPARKNSPTKLVKDYHQYRHIAKAFVDLVLANPVLSIKVIWFFDHTLNPIIPNSKTSRQHYRHFHLRFCMPQKYKSMLDLNKVYSAGEDKPSYKCDE